MKNNIIIILVVTLQMILTSSKNQFIKHQIKLNKYKFRNKNQDDDKSSNKAQQMYAYIDEKLQSVGQYFINLNNVVDKIARQNIISGIEKYLDIINQQRALLIQDHIINEGQLSKVDQQISQFQNQLRTIKQQQIQLQVQMHQQPSTYIQHSVDYNTNSNVYQQTSSLVDNSNMKIIRQYHSPVQPDYHGIQQTMFNMEPLSSQQYYEQPLIHVHHEVDVQPQQQQIEFVHPKNNVDDSIKDIQRQVQEQNQRQKEIIQSLNLMKDKIDKIEYYQQKSSKPNHIPQNHNLQTHNIQTHLSEQQDQIDTKSSDNDSQDDDQDQQEDSPTHDTNLQHEHESQSKSDQLDENVPEQKKDDSQDKATKTDDSSEYQNKENTIEHTKVHLTNNKDQDDDLQQVDRILQSLDNPAVIQKLKSKLQGSFGINNQTNTQNQQQQKQQTQKSKQNQPRRIKKKKG